VKRSSCLVTTSATHSHVGKHQEDSACNFVYNDVVEWGKDIKPLHVTLLSVFLVYRTDNIYIHYYNLDNYFGLAFSYAIFYEIFLTFLFELLQIESFLNNIGLDAQGDLHHVLDLNERK